MYIYTSLNIQYPHKHIKDAHYNSIDIFPMVPHNKESIAYRDIYL